MDRPFLSGEHTVHLSLSGDPRDVRSYQVVEAGGIAVVHVIGPAHGWIWGRATGYFHGKESEIYARDHAEIYVTAKSKVWVTGHVKLFYEADEGLIINQGYGEVHTGVGPIVLAYGESHTFAPAGADVRLNAYAKWHVEGTDEVRGNKDHYRPGYYVDPNLR